MNYLLLIFVIIGLFWLASKWLSYLKATRGTEGYAKRRIFFYLFMAFITLTGITSIFANALFELLELEKPVQFEWMSFGAFVILAFAAIRIAESGQKKETKKETTTTQNHSGSGNNVAGNTTSIKNSKNVNTGEIKARDVHIGDTIIKPSKNKAAKELTSLHLVNTQDIIGRKKDIKELHTLLSNAKKVVVVNGQGGIGKTTLAEAYIFEYYNEYEHIAWITNNPDQTFVDSFSQNSDLVKNLHMEVTGMKSNEIYQEIMRRLRNFKKRPNLLVIDNATASLEKHLHQLPTQPNWHLLVTSREVIATMHLKKLGFLSPDDAVNLFQKHCTRFHDTKEILDIVKTVDYHTLSIEILAKTAQRRNTDIKKLKVAIENNLKVNVKTKHSNLKKIDTITSYLCTIFDLSKLSEEEIWLMKQFTCLPPEFHTFDLLKYLLFSKDDKKSEDFAETLTELQENGWLLYNPTTNSYKIHRIIGEVTFQKQNANIDDIEYLLEQVSQLLSIDQTKDNPIDKFKWIPFGNALLNRFTASTTSFSLLQNNLAIVLRNLGEYKKAKKLLEKAIVSDEKNLGKDHPSTVRSYSNLAAVLQNLSEYKEAKKLLEKVIALNEKNFGKDHPSTMVSYSNLATVLHDLGEYKKAKKLFKKVTVSDEKNFGTNHPSTAICYSNLALVLKDLGEYTEAKKLLEKAIVSNEKNFGKDHPSTVIRYSNLALVLQDLGEYTEAKKLFEKVIVSNEKNLGKDHPSTAISYSNLSTVLRDLGEYNEAKELLEKATVSDEENLGKDHPSTAIRYSNLALVLQNLGQYTEAKVLLEKATVSDEKNFGTDHPSTAISYSNLALVLKDLDNLEDALLLLNKALKIFKKKAT